MPLTRRHLLGSLTATAVAAAQPSLLHALAIATAAADDDTPLHDPLRPGYHLLPARNWMNDPCGPIYYRGLYHMFHQYNPHAAVWGDMHWAHATSPDMVHWTRRAVALAPTPGGADALGCFTGSAILLQGRPAFIYTGIRTLPPGDATYLPPNDVRESQNLAIALDDTLDHWRKLPQPVIPDPPDGMQVTGFRDPAPFQYQGTWYLALGCGIARKGGMVLLYRAAAPDLSRWEYLHPLYEGTWNGVVDKDVVGTGEMFECPDFFALEDEAHPGVTKHVLFYSTLHKTLWHTGTLDPRTLRFQPEHSGELDYGDRAYYAPKSQLDAAGDRILWGWLPETRPQAEYARAGWSGMMSIPRRLTVRDGQLQFSPARQLASLRGTQNPSAAQLSSTQQELLTMLEPAAAASPTTITDSRGALLQIITDATLAPGTLRLNERTVVLPRPLSTTPTLHLFTDNSVLELILDRTLPVTVRFYAREPQTPVLTLALPTPYSLGKARSFALNSIWPA
ncbi:MAG: glycoside hydrolase family 32 protein [Acidobacteriota bacterium]|nr:glycoside hydrolase family 32 protein [Acidobacteriota bacterium]